MVPPALVEVGQPVSEGDLEDFEAGRGHPADFEVADNHHFEPPAEEVGGKVDVHHSVIDVVELALRVIRRVERAVLRIRPLRQGLTKGWVKESEQLPSLI